MNSSHLPLPGPSLLKEARSSAPGVSSARRRRLAASLLAAALSLVPSARAAWTYAGGVLNAAQTYDGAGVDSALDPRSQGTSSQNDYIGNGNGGTGSITMVSGTLTIGASDFKVAQGSGSNGTLNANGGTLNINQIGQWGGGIGMGGTGVLNIASGAVVNWQTSGSSEQRFMIGNGSTGNGTLNLNGGTLNNTLDAAQALTDAERQWRVGSDGGTGTINLNSGTWNVTGAIPFFLGGKYTALNGTPTLNQTATVSVIHITHGSLVQTGIATSTGFSTTSSTFTIGTNDYVNFIAGGTGSLSLQGWQEADFQALVDAGKIRLNGVAVAGQYSNFVYSSAGGQGIYKLSGALVAPAIGTLPASSSGTVGQNFSLSASVSGNPAPSVQWQKSTDNGGTWADLSGAISSTLAFAPLAYADNGLYRLVATNSVGSATSDSATLTVTYPNPTFATPPASQTVLAGSDVTLVAAATGVGTLTYQWQKDGSDLSGQTGTSLSLADIAASAIGSYTVVVTDHAAEASGLSATTSSATAVLTVLDIALPQHAISLNFVGAASSGNAFGGATDLGLLASGDLAGFLPVASWNNSAATNGVASQATPLALVDNTGAGTPASATWSSTNTWAVLASQGAASAKTEAGRLLHGYIERRLSNAPGNASATFTQIPYGTYDVYVYLTGGAVGQVGKVTANGDDNTARYYKAAGGTLGTSPAFMMSPAATLSEAQGLAYNANFVRLAGLSGASLTVAVADALTGTNAGGLAGVSIVDVTPSGTAYPPLVATPPASLFKPGGSNVSFTVSASSINAGGVLSYQWQKDSVNLPGQTSATLSLTNVSSADTGSYTVVVTDSPAGKTPASVSQSASLVVVDGARPALVNVDIGTASSGVMAGEGVLRTSGIPESGANQNLGQGSEVWTGLTGASGSATYSTLKDSAGFTLAGLSFQTAGAGGVEDNTTAGFLGSSTTGAGPLMRDMLYTDSTTTPITCTVGGLGDFVGKKFTLVVYAVGKRSTNLFESESTINDDATVTLSGNNNHLGTAPQLTDNSAGRNPAENPQAYVAFQGIVSATGTVSWTLGPGTGSDVGRVPLNGFQLLLTNEDVNVPPTVNTDPVGATILAGLPYTLTAGVTASPAASLQWQKSTDGGSTWANISGATASSYAFAAVSASDAGQYRLVASNAVGTDTSNAATLVVQSYPLSASRGISLNWRESGTTGVLASTDVAGIVGLANWDNRIPSATTFANLVDSTGATTSASVQLSVGGAWHAFTATPALPMQRLFANYWDIAPGGSAVGATATLTASGLSYASYDVYVYFATDGANNARTAQLAINGGAPVFAKMMGSGNTTAFPTYMAEGTGADAGSATLGSYVKFTGLSGTGFTLVATKVDANYGIAGIQIVNTAPTLSPLEAWRQTHFGTTANSGQAADAADPDGDGLANLLEYAFGENPMVANDGPSVVTTTPGGVLALTFVHIDDPALSYVVEASNDLAGPWSPAQTYTGFTAAGTTTYTDNVALNSVSRRFLRVKVTRP